MPDYTPPTDEIRVGWLTNDTQRSVDFKRRRFPQMEDNYHLYRDQVRPNLLTQRQSVNIPVIRETISSWMSKNDESPELFFKVRGRGYSYKKGEVIVNELWKDQLKKDKLWMKDNMDKKLVGLFGRSFKYGYFDFRSGKVKCNIVLPHDIDMDPYLDITDLNSSTFFNHKNIYVPLRNILANPTFFATGKEKLKDYLGSKEGLLKSGSNTEDKQARENLLRGLDANNFDHFVSSDPVVDLTYSHKMVWNPERQMFVRHLIIYAMGAVVLYDRPLYKAIGLNYLPYSSWASDPDIMDPWSDGPADNTRTINKIINMYFSQDVENRAYANFGMYFYDNRGGIQPDSFIAKPFGMYGVPGNPAELLQRMDIKPLPDTHNAIEYLKNLVQSSLAQTPTERGEQTQSRTTLGEIQLDLRSSGQRNAVVAKQYQSSWEEFGKIWYDLMAYNKVEDIVLEKEADNGDMYEEKVPKAKWAVRKGYKCQVTLKSQKEQEDNNELNKLQFVKQSFPDNPVAQRIVRKKQLELIGWDPKEVDDVMAVEDKKPALPPGTMDPTTQLPAGGQLKTPVATPTAPRKPVPATV